MTAGACGMGSRDVPRGTVVRFSGFLFIWVDVGLPGERQTSQTLLEMCYLCSETKTKTYDNNHQKDCKVLS